MKNVLAVSFGEDSKAYEALSSLKELDGQDQLDLTAAAVVARSEDGHIDTKDQVGDDEMTGTATGGVVGLIIGILGGPFGILLGGVTGLLIGSLYDLDESDATESALGDISRTVRPGKTALLAAAEDAQRAAAQAARKRLREQRQAKTKEEIRAKIDELKAKLKGLRVGAGGG